VQFGEAVGEVLKNLGPFHGVVAHSYSAISTLWYLSVHPEVCVPRMVTLGCPAELTGILARFSRRLELPEGLIERMTPLLEERMGVSAVEVSAPGAASSLTRTQGLIVHDEKDPIVPHANAVALSEAWPGSTLHTTQGLGHNRTFQDPGVIRAVAEFLCGESASGRTRAQRGDPEAVL
jgi:pimeloyl-ACP methyl ester carboxylesterase